MLHIFSTMIFRDGIKTVFLGKYSITPMVPMCTQFAFIQYFRVTVHLSVLFLYYQGSSQIDYREGNVTAANFLAALSGDQAKAKGRVLQTTNESNIFVFFSDHGSPGLLHFPNVFIALIIFILPDTSPFLILGCRFTRLGFC